MLVWGNQYNVDRLVKINNLRERNCLMASI